MTLKTFKLPINGDFLDTAETFEVINPATGKPFATCPLPSSKQIDAIIGAAEDAQKKWWALEDQERRKLLVACADSLDEHVEDIAILLSKEQGKPIKDAKREVKGVPAYFRMIAESPIEDNLVTDSAKAQTKVTHKPLGVVGAISAWNYPLALAAWKIAPALLTGNSAVLKPSPDTPLSSLKLVTHLQKVLPEGLVGIVTGFEKEGEQLVTHPAVSKVSFTGSTGVGRIINESASPDLKRVTLELGGNDAAIVLKDADPKAIAKAIFDSGFVNCGQTCIAIKRVFVHESIHDELVAEVTKLATGAKIGDGLDPETHFGPLANARQRQHVEALVEDAKAKGAKIHCGGEKGEGEGFFYKITVVSGVKEGVRIVDEEQFGPVLPFLSFKDEQDAIERANKTEYGLGGSIWTKDISKGESLASQLECGTAWVNQHASLDMKAPFGGAKSSGLGVEHGKEGLLAFTQKQVISTKL